MYPHPTQPIVHVRVMDDFTGQKDALSRKFCDGFVGVFDGALHAVTKTELHRQQKRQPVSLQTEVVGLHEIDDLATVVFAELRTNFRPKTKTFLKIYLIQSVPQARRL